VVDLGHAAEGDARGLAPALRITPAFRSHLLPLLLSNRQPTKL
jgi:hypothetical protein